MRIRGYSEAIGTHSQFLIADNPETWNQLNYYFGMRTFQAVKPSVKTIIALALALQLSTIALAQVVSSSVPPVAAQILLCPAVSSA